MRPSSGKKSFLILSGLVVAAAVAAIVVVVSQDKKVEGVGSEGSGSEIADRGSGGTDPGSNKVPDPGSNKAPDPDTGSQAGVDPGSNKAPDSGSSKVPDSGSNKTIDSGSGNGSAPIPTLPDLVKITLGTKPAGARILVDGVEQPVRTPQSFTLPRSNKRVKIVLRLSSYEDLEIPFTADHDYSSDHVFKPKKKAPPPPDPRRGSGSKGSGGTPGQGSSDSDLMKPS
jgi:hypothetical protein